jgi:hypothetical protein
MIIGGHVSSYQPANCLTRQPWFEAIALLSRELDADANLVPSEAARPAVLEWAISEAEVLHC